MEQLPRARQVESIDVLPVGSVHAIEQLPHLVLLDPAGVEFAPATEWMLWLTANDCSRHTARAYAMSLLRFMRFLWAVEHPWDRASDVEARDFVLWAKSTTKFVGNKQASGPRGRVNVVTGKPNPTSRYAPKTINHTLTAVHEFYSFQLDRGQGPVMNPIPGARVRNAHHNPEDPFPPMRRASLRQKEPTRVPRAMPDAEFDRFFGRLRCNRDRALVAFYVSSGVRASELLSLTGEMLNYGDHLICVIRKGGALQWVPVSPDAFVWLRLYQLERGTPKPGERVWLTERDPRRPLSYDALRGVIARANALLGANWTAHDLRHTFAIRALEGGLAVHELQELLGHASLATTSVYTAPRLDDLVAHHQAALTRRRFGGEAPVGPASPVGAYDQDELSTVFGSCS